MTTLFASKARCISASTLFMVALSTTPAWSQLPIPPEKTTVPAQKPTPAQVKQAKKDLAEGNKLLKSKSYAEALAKLEAAHAVDPKTSTLLGIAQCQRETQKLLLALGSYEKAQSSPPKPLTKKEKETIEKAIAELKDLIGTVVVKLTPPGAAVKLDGELVPESQLGSPIRFEPGKHKVSAAMPDFEPFEGEVDVQPAREALVNIELKPEIKTGRVTVKARGGEAAKVFVDGNEVGAAPWEGDLAPGTHNIQIRGEKLESSLKTIEIAAKSAMELELELEPKAAPTPAPAPAKVRYAVAVSPPGAQLTLGGKVVGTTGELEPGTYELRASAPGYVSVSKPITVLEGQGFADTINLVPEEPRHPTLRAGALVGVASLPRPINAEAMIKLWDAVGIGLRYGMLPDIEVDTVKVELNAVQGIVRWFPWRKSFYIGSGIGSQTFKVSLTRSFAVNGQAGTLLTQADASMLFVSPQVGWLWHWDSGVTLGVNLGVQIPFGGDPGVKSSWNSLAIPDNPIYRGVLGQVADDIKTVDNATKIVAKIPLPNLDLLRIGFFF